MNLLYAYAMLMLTDLKIYYLMATYEPAHDSIAGMAIESPTVNASMEHIISGLFDLEDETFWHGNSNVSLN